MEPAFLKFDIKIKMTVAKDEYAEGALRLFHGTLLHFFFFFFYSGNTDTVQLLNLGFTSPVFRNVGFTIEQVLNSMVLNLSKQTGTDSGYRLQYGYRD